MCIYHSFEHHSISDLHESESTLQFRVQEELLIDLDLNLVQLVTTMILTKHTPVGPKHQLTEYPMCIYRSFEHHSISDLHAVQFRVQEELLIDLDLNLVQLVTTMILMKHTPVGPKHQLMEYPMCIYRSFEHHSVSDLHAVQFRVQEELLIDLDLNLVHLVTTTISTKHTSVGPKHQLMEYPMCIYHSVEHHSVSDLHAVQF